MQICKFLKISATLNLIITKYLTFGIGLSDSNKNSNSNNNIDITKYQIKVATQMSY